MMWFDWNSLLCTIIIGFISIIILKVYFKLTTGWCKSNVCLIGTTAIVTGANAGIGYQTATDFAKRGAKVILACRNKEKADAACAKIKTETHNENVFVKIVDFGSLDSIRKFAEDINKTEENWDILVNNAGIADREYKLSEDGFLLLMQTNYFGPFLLTNLLLDHITNEKQSQPRRIVNVASIMANFCYLNLKNLNVHQWGDLPYCQSKLCNILFTRELASRLKGTNITTYSVHPGIIKTGLAKQVLSWTEILYPFFKNEVEGAQTTIHCAVSDSIEHLSGEHFHDCQPVRRYLSASNDLLPKKLWTETEKLLSMK